MHGPGVRAMVLRAQGRPLEAARVELPPPAAGQLRVRVLACALCRTDLHVADGDLPHPKLPLVPGHQVVGEVIATGPGADPTLVGTRVGIPWLGWTCGVCEYCRSERENLCASARFTGYDLDGGMAEEVIADARFCLPLPAAADPAQVAPLLCAGLIGYRSLRMAGEAPRLGLYGFGAAAHIVIQVARHRGQRVFAFVRRGDEAAARFALSLGAEWAGPSDAPAPEELDAAIIFAPAGELVPAALAATARGGTVVCGGIHMTDIPSFPYQLLWGERTLRSVANLTRADGREFLALAGRIGIRTEVELHRLEAANLALDRLREGAVHGAAVLTP